MPKELKNKTYDFFPRGRNLKGFNYILVVVIGLLMSLFQLYTAGFGQYEAILQRSIHLSFALVLIFLLYPFRAGKEENSVPFYDYILAFLSAGSVAYIPIYYKDLVLRAGYVTTTDFIVGIITIFLIFEAARRVVGIILPSFCLVIFLYTYFGRYIPGYFGIKGFSIMSIVRHMYYSTEGIFGVPLGATASFVFLFILFGIILGATGMGQVFIDIALALFGKTQGGAAKTAVVASSLFGTINGSSVANVYGTGLFTIPLMKRSGYEDYFAGAVEAAASTGGQIMPPVMGAGAFIMAEFLGISYLKVAIAALFPAILYYVGVFSMVHLEAKRLGLKALPKEEIPNLKDVLLKRGFLLIPILFLMYYLVSGYTPTRAAYVAILVSFVISIFDKKNRMSISEVITVLSKGAFTALELIICCAVIGFVIGTVSLTGLALKIANLVVILSKGNFLFALILCQLLCMLLGMAIPTTAKYIMVSMMVAPALTLMGIPAIAAHLFIFYFAILADLTPPVAMASMAAASIAKSNFFKTAITAVLLALGGYLVPYMFVYHPNLLLGITSFSWWRIIFSSITGIVGIYFLSTVVANWAFTKLTLIHRLIIFVGAILLITTKLTLAIIGYILVFFSYYLNYRKYKILSIKK